MELFKRKNQDYGDAFANYGAIGVLVRMGDKINRLSSVTNNGVHLVDNESVRDTIIDLQSYAAMANMLLDEKKKHKIYFYTVLIFYFLYLRKIQIPILHIFSDGLYPFHSFFYIHF